MCGTFKRPASSRAKVVFPAQLEPMTTTRFMYIFMRGEEYNDEAQQAAIALQDATETPSFANGKTVALGVG